MMTRALYSQDTIHRSLAVAVTNLRSPRRRHNGLEVKNDGFPADSTPRTPR